jgi:hypothetical protein
MSNTIYASFEKPNPLDIAFLGTLPFNSSEIIIYFVVFCIGASFSYKNLNAGVASIVGFVTVFRMLGWLSLDYGVITIMWILAGVLIFSRMRSNEE